MNKLHEWVNTGLIVLVAILVLVGGNQSGQVGASGTRFPNGISADTTSPSAGQVRGTTLTVTSNASIAGTATTTGKFVAAGGLLCSYTRATSTALSADTMAATELVDANGLPYCGMTVQKTGAVATTTLTFPATSSVSNLLPNAGDRMQWCMAPATTTAVAVIIAEGTGWNFLMASSTDFRTLTVGGNNGTLARTVQGGTTMCANMIRDFNSDMSLIITPTGQAQ